MTFERTQNNPGEKSLHWVKPSVNRATAWLYVLTFILVSLESAPSLASQIAYAQSPHSIGPNQAVLNLFDQTPETTWCSQPAQGTQTHHLQIALKKRVSVDHIDIELGQDPASPIDVEISNGSRSVSFKWVGSSIHLKFERQFEGQIFDMYFSTPKDQPELCVSELKMLDNGINLLKIPSQKARSYSAISGTWFEGTPGTTEKKLIFAIDGTWSWVHKPFFRKAEKRISGTYRIHNNVLRLHVKGSRKTWSLPLSKERVVIDPDDFDAPDFDYDTLILKGPQPSIIAGSYNNARFDALN
mgnify:FL=1